MAYRISTLEVPADDPFRNDALERRTSVEFLIGLIERVGGPFVLALDSPWGTGKTTLVRMLEAEPKRQEFSCIYFNAWQVDYVTDPLVALVSSIDRLEVGTAGAAATFKAHLKTARRLTGLVARRTAVAAAKAVTVGALDLEKEIEAAAAELAGSSVNDVVEAFQKEGALLEKFRGELEKAIEQLPSIGKKPTLVFFIDEIDRCRPTFSIELLERIKHLFDVPNILFVLSLDKAQLEASIAAVYGQDINASEYLRRFIDLEYTAPAIKTKRFVESMMARFGLDEIFASRTGPEICYDRSNFVDFFSALADAVPLSLRTQERSMTRLRVVMDQTPTNHYLYPVLAAVLIVLRVSAPKLFEQLRHGTATAEHVMAHLTALPDGRKIITGREGIVIEAFLITADEDEDEDRKDSCVSELRAISKNENNPEYIHARELLEMIEAIRRPGRFHGPKLSALIDKIELAAGIN